MLAMDFVHSRLNTRNEGLRLQNESRDGDVHLQAKLSSEGAKKADSSNNGTAVDGYNRNDVLCGKNKAAFNHEGNRQFRDLVSSFVDEYRKAESRLNKAIIVHKIVERIRSMGGRFLKQNILSEEWSELNGSQIREKVGHAIRDAAALLGESGRRKKETKKRNTLKKKKRRRSSQEQETMSFNHRYHPTMTLPFLHDTAFRGQLRNFMELESSSCSSSSLCDCSQGSVTSYLSDQPVRPVSNKLDWVLPEDEDDRFLDYIDRSLGPLADDAFEDPLQNFLLA